MHIKRILSPFSFSGEVDPSWRCPRLGSEAIWSCLVARATATRSNGLRLLSCYYVQSAEDVFFTARTTPKHHCVTSH